MSKIVALDPSYTCTGLAVIEDGKPIRWTKLTFKGAKSKAEKRARLRAWLAEHTTDANLLVIEQLWTGPGASISAACLDVAYSQKIEARALNTRSWKKRILGSSNASKEDSVRVAVDATAATITDDNEADAICIGLAAYKFPELLKRPE